MWGQGDSEGFWGLERWRELVPLTEEGDPHFD